MMGGDVLNGLRDRNVLVVEDIIDTGLTMAFLLKQLENAGVKEVKVASMLVKRTSKSSGYRPDCKCIGLLHSRDWTRE